MKHIDQEIAIETETPFGENVPIGVSSPLLGRLLEMARPCVRMAIEGASSSLGAPPAWLERASDIRTIGFARRGTQTVLLVKAPALGDAMPEIFDQQKLWSGVANAEDTVIQLIARAGDSVRRQDIASDMYDKPLLRHFTHWHSLFRHDVSRVIMPTSSGQSNDFLVLSNEMVQSAKLLSARTPQPRQIRFVGKLDMVRYSTRSFGLLLERGDEVLGILQEGDPELLQRHLGKEITVFGKAIYRPSGTLLRVDAQEISDTTEGREAFSTIPGPLARTIRLEKKPQSSRTGVSAFFDTWPGEETDAELLAALGEVRN